MRLCDSWHFLVHKITIKLSGGFSTWFFSTFQNGLRRLDLVIEGQGPLIMKQPTVLCNCVSSASLGQAQISSCYVEQPPLDNSWCFSPCHPNASNEGLVSTELGTILICDASPELSITIAVVVFSRYHGELLDLRQRQPWRSLPGQMSSRICRLGRRSSKLHLINRIESRKQLKFCSRDRMATTISTQRGQVRCLCLKNPRLSSVKQHHPAS